MPIEDAVERPERPSVPVLIVGGGPVGLALALELGTRGVACTLVDERDGTVTIPKISFVHARTMEFFRRWGIAEAVERVSWPADYPRDFIYLTSMTGHEIARSPIPPYAAGADRHVTPNGHIHCPQSAWEPILRDAARALPQVTLRYRTRLDDFAQDADGVRARLTDLETGRTESLSAGYLIGCDGPDSTVRERLGIALEGEGRLSNSLSIFFRSTELATLHDKGWGRFYRLIDHGGHWADLIAIDGKELWRLTLLALEGVDASSAVDVDAALQRAVGTAFAYEVLSILPWERRDQIAAHYGIGRVFLAGDSVHQLSPTGGLGVSTGIADAVDLGWKLAAVIEGWGGDRLLDSYEVERKPVAHRNVEESTAYFRRIRLLPPGPGTVGDPAESAPVIEAFRAQIERQTEADILYISEHLKFGYCYEPSPICVPDGTRPPEAKGNDYVPNARPGARAPHLWLADGRSILDLFGAGFTLLRLGADAPAGDAIAAAAELRGVPLGVVALAEDKARALYERRLVLVRPDGHVDWRSDRLPDDPLRLIDRVRGAA